MIEIGDSAREYFTRLVQQQGIPGLGIRLRAVDGGTPRGDCRLEFCEPEDVRGDDWTIECEGFSLFVDSTSAPFLDGTHIEFSAERAGGQLVIRAPKLKGTVPGAGAGLVERVRYVLDSDINPAVASHGGRVSLVEVSADGVVLLRFGGGCHGCGQVDLTLKHGIEKTLREKVPEITAVRDVTDHSTGENPYIKR